MRPTLPRLRRTPRLLGALALLAVLGVFAARPAAPSLSAQGTETLVAYEMVNQFPQRDGAAEGLFQSPSDLDVMRDGHVFIADPGIGGIHLLLPTGAFTTPFGVTGGFPQQLGQVGDIAVGPDPDVPGFPFSAERLYVLDTAVERVVIYGPGGDYRGQWEDINGQSLAASPSGPVYVLDRDSTQVRAFDAASGAELWAFGERGLEDGQFTNLTDVDVSPDGLTLAVADKRGLRVQLFDLAAQEELDGGAPPLALRTVYDLRDARFTLGDNTCGGDRVNALGEDKVFLGQGESACLVDGRDVSQAIAASASRSTICRATVTLPRLKAGSQLYYAYAFSDPNAGPCSNKRTDLDSTPIIVSYSDEELRQVDTIYEAASNEDAASPLLFAPESLAFTGPETLFVQDSSSQLRFYDRAGTQIGTAQRTSQAGNFSSDFNVTNVIRATGSEVVGEIYGYYLKISRSQGAFNVEGGIGRFETVEERTRQGIELVLEEVWTDPLVSSFQEISIPALAYNPVSGELLVVSVDRVESQREQDTVLRRYSQDGREIKPAFDLPDDGQTNPYVSLRVGPDGRIYALDDLLDVVRVYAPDGSPLYEVPVAFDARSVAGGPASSDGEVFVLREPGSIERYDRDGKVTARLDGRPLSFSDPTTLSDLAVDEDGRVDVADAQSSLISVFEPSDDPLTLPVPDDSDCRYVGLAEADPTALDLGDPTELTLTMKGTCGISEPPTDIVVVVPYFGRLQQGVDPSVAQQNEMIQLIARVNFDRHRVGLVSHFSTVTVDQELTGDRETYIESVRDVTRFDPPNPDVRPRLRDAIEEAATLFDDPERRKVMVLLRVDYCSAANEPFPGACVGYPPAEEAAAAARAEGITMVVANSGPGAFDLASSDEDAFFGVEPAHRRMVRYAPPDTLGEGFELVVEIPDELTVDPDSISGGGTWSAPSITWPLATIDQETSTFSVSLEPTEGGSWPAFSSALATFDNGWGAPETLTFEPPTVDVTAPTASLPTATSTPEPTSTPPPTETPAATPEPVAIYLPFAATDYCFPAEPRIDMVLAVDVSSSMQGEKIEAARQALHTFVGVVNLGERRDKVAIVDFATQATLVQGLTADRAALDAAIDRIATRSGTRIDRGLTAALDELDAGGREDAAQAVILLSDGRQVEEPETARQAGAEARGRGVDVYTIGLGADIDEALMVDVAGDAARYFPAPTPGDLEAVYRDIAAGLVGCR